MKDKISIPYTKAGGLSSTNEEYKFDRGDLLTSKYKAGKLLLVMERTNHESDNLWRLYKVLDLHTEDIWLENQRFLDEQYIKVA